MTRVLSCLVATFALALPLQSALAETLVYDTFITNPGRSSAFLIGTNVENTIPRRSAAMQFSPSLTGDLVRIEVALLDYLIEDWAMTVQILPDVNGSPFFEPIETIFVPDGPRGISGNFSIEASGQTRLMSDELYWLALAPGTETMSLGWFISGFEGTGSDKAISFQPPGVGGWFIAAPDLNQSAFRIYADNVIPLPGAAWLLLSALGSLGAIRRVKKPRASCRG